MLRLLHDLTGPRGIVWCHGIAWESDMISGEIHVTQ
jgi:hypothetical protein